MSVRGKPVRALLAALVAAALAQQASADGFIVMRPHPRPLPRPMVPPAVKYHKVKVEIRGRVATTFVDQVFVNPNRRQMEGEYIFPIPEGASVSRFTLDIGGETVEAELLDAEKARRIYEDIVRRMKDPALLEYMGRGLFRARIFPIPPGGERRITLRYEEQVPKNGSLYAYRYPLNTEKFSSKPIEEVTVDVRLSGDRPVRAVVCPSHPGQAKVQRKPNGTASVSLRARHVRPDRDFIVYYGLGGELAVDLVAHRRVAAGSFGGATRRGRGDGDGYFMLAISPPADVGYRSPPRPKDLVLVIDTSGSMAGEKLEQAKGALGYCLKSLAPGDGFNVVRFSTEAEAFRDALVPATRGNVREAMDFVERFRARGGTAIEEALGLAFRSIRDVERPRGRPLMVAFLTDGRPTIGERDPDAILKSVKKANRPNARVFVFGVGNDLNTRLLDRLAETGRGSRTYVAPEEDIEVAVSAFYDRIASPVLTDLRLEFGRGLEISDVYPRSLGDLFRGDEIVVYGRYRVASGSFRKVTRRDRGRFGSHVVTLTGRTADGERSYVFEPGWPGEEPSNAFIARLWAVRKIGYMLDQIRLHGRSAELKTEIVRLAKRFGIMTPYTSMLVLEDETTRPGGRRRGPAVPLSRPAAPEERAAFKTRAEALSGARDSGGAAVGASREFDRMRKGGLAGGKLLEGLEEKARRQVKHLEDKTFYLEGGVWWDSEVEADAPRTKVAYLSNEYFKLLKDNPGIGPYLALGERVVFVVGGTTYEVAP